MANSDLIVLHTRTADQQIFAAEYRDVDEWQSVFPSELSDLSALHPTADDACRYVRGALHELQTCSDVEECIAKILNEL